MRKTVILSLDAMFDADLAAYGPETWLGDWLRHAAVCSQVKTVFPALTYPAHVTLMTGCQPAAHGIGQNQPFQPDTEAVMRAWYWDAAAVKRPTLFDAVKQQGGRCASMLWPVTGKNRAICWNFPEVLALPGENQVLKMLAYGNAPWIGLMEVKHGRSRVSTHEPHLSEYAITLVQDVLRAHQPQLTCAHLVDLDEMRHLHGTHSAEAKEALRRNEARVRTVWESMQQLPGMEDALLVLVSDHGQADVDETVVLQKKLDEAGVGEGVQVQSNGMSAYLFGTRDALETAAAWLRLHGETAGVSHVYDRAELNAMGAVAGPGMAVEAAPGVVFADLLSKEKREKATHGFGLGHHAENCLLAVRGAGIREGVTLDSMPMMDVAPTIAGLMGIDFPNADGTDHSAEIIEKR